MNDLTTRLDALSINVTLAGLGVMCRTLAGEIVAALKPLNDLLAEESDSAWAEAVKDWQLEQGRACSRSKYDVPYLVYCLGWHGLREVPEGTPSDVRYLSDTDGLADALQEMRADLIRFFARPTHAEGECGLPDKILYPHDTIVLRRPYKIEADYDMVGGGFVLKATARYHLWNSADTKPGTVLR